MPSSGGGGGGGDSTTTNIPWEEAQPFLRKGFREAASLYNTGQLAPVASESPWSVAGRTMGAEQALGGGFGATQGALDLTNRTLGGEYLDLQNNPLFQDAISYAQQPVIDAWNQQIRPGIDATFAGTAGGMGSGAYASKLNEGQDILARNLSGAATQAGAQMYGDERARMQQSAAFAPGLEQAGYGTFDRLMGYGGAEDARRQFELEQPQSALEAYTALINNNPGVNFGTSTTNQSGYEPGPLDYLSTAGGLGLLGFSMFCDERAKQDAHRIGELDNGAGVYRFRYKMDVADLGNEAPWHIGPMAQELEEVQPEAVHTTQNGLKFVRVEVL